MKLTTKDIIAAIVSLIGGLVAVIGAINFFLKGYRELLQGNIADGNATGAKMLTFVFPGMNDLCVLGGIGLLVAAFGFFLKKRWAFTTAIIASVLVLLSSLLATFWPLMIALPLRYFPIFLTILVVWCVLLLYVRPVGAKLFTLSTLAGITMCLTWMNGVAGINMILKTKGLPLHIVTQQLNWLAAIGLGIFAIAVLYRKDWALPFGLGGALLSLIAGTPLAYTNSIQTNELSMFSYGPFAAIILLLAFLIFNDKLWVKVNKPKVEAELEKEVAV